MFREWLDQPTSWRVLNAASGTVTAVADPDVVLARWAEGLGAPRLAFRCGTEEQLLHRIQSGFWYPLSSCLDDDGERASVRFEIGGVEVNSFAPESEPAVIGVIRLDD